MRASLTEVHLESLRTAKYISSIYNGIVKEQKNILLEICYSWTHFNGKQAQQMAKLHIHSRILPSGYKKQMKNSVFKKENFTISIIEDLVFEFQNLRYCWKEAQVRFLGIRASFKALFCEEKTSLKNIWFYGRFLCASNYLALNPLRFPFSCNFSSEKHSQKKHLFFL